MNYLWVTGMFRSGTTLLAKMLDAHPKIAFTSDPYRPYFNDLRDMVARKNGLLKNNLPHMPLSDYFCDDEQLKVMKFVQSANLDMEIPKGHLEELKNLIAKRGMEFSPFVAQHVDELKGRNYCELFHSMMKLVAKYYGKGDEEIVGSKEVWCNEFTSVLLRSFNELKVINIIRDPRAVCASRNIIGEKYPWLFLARQWRKLSIFSWLFTNYREFSKSLLVIRYEDLIQNPEEVSKKICSFIGVDFSYDMIDGNKFREGDGSSWSQNSSYGTSKEISAKYSEKWREVLNEDQIKLIEMLCCHEMKLFGYDPINEGVDILSEKYVYDPLIVKQEELAEWIKQYSDTRPIFNLIEMSKELVRNRLMHMDDNEIVQLKASNEIIESLFIDRQYFNYARKSVFQEEKI